MYNSNINEEASDIEQKQKIIFNVTRAICTRIKDFHDILVEPPPVNSKNASKTQNFKRIFSAFAHYYDGGNFEPPVGQHPTPSDEIAGDGDRVQQRRVVGRVTELGHLPGVARSIF